MVCFKINHCAGGKQPKMRPGWHMIGEEEEKKMRVKQHMVFTSGPSAGVAKGLRIVCQERFGEEAVEGNFHKVDIYTLCFISI